MHFHPGNKNDQNQILLYKLVQETQQFLSTIKETLNKKKADVVLEDEILQVQITCAEPVRIELCVHWPLCKKMIWDGQWTECQSPLTHGADTSNIHFDYLQQSSFGNLSGEFSRI